MNKYMEEQSLLHNKVGTSKERTLEIHPIICKTASLFSSEVGLLKNEVKYLMFFIPEDKGEVNSQVDANNNNAFKKKPEQAGQLQEQGIDVLARKFRTKHWVCGYIQAV